MTCQNLIITADVGVKVRSVHLIGWIEAFEYEQQDFASDRLQ